MNGFYLRILLFLLLLLLLIITAIHTDFSTRMMIETPKEDILQQFKENREQYQNIAQIIWNHRDYFDQYYIDTGSVKYIGGAFSFYQLGGLLNQEIKSLFSISEWPIYEEFIKNYRPYAIGGRPPLYSMSGDLGILPAIEFVYIDKDGKFSTLTELFYIPHNENEDIYLLEDTLEYFSVGRGIPEKLNDNWFYLRTIIESTW